MFRADGLPAPSGGVQKFNPLNLTATYTGTGLILPPDHSLDEILASIMARRAEFPNEIVHSVAIISCSTVQEIETKLLGVFNSSLNGPTFQQVINEYHHAVIYSTFKLRHGRKPRMMLPWVPCKRCKYSVSSEVEPQ